jgi:hypothetical protein
MQEIAMQHWSDLLMFTAQCCDANEYLEFGQTCASTGDCYAKWRPMGAVYWFSIPYRLGVSPSILFVAHLLLMAISIWLSCLAMQKLLRNIPATGKFTPGFTMIVAAAIASHVFFLYPVLFITLTDAPASLLVLIAVWLLLLVPDGKCQRIVVPITVGFCFGMAVWLRIFFLYPVLIFLVVGSLYWLADKKRNLAALGLLVALLPIAAQYYATWNRTGAISFFIPEKTRGLFAEHLDNKAIGYDTTLPPGKHYWYSSCENCLPLMQAFRTNDFYSVKCIFLGRVNFYLGSYSWRTYIPMQREYPTWGANLFEQDQDKTGTKGTWRFVNMKKSENIETAPDDSKSADKLSKPNPAAYGEMFRTVELQASNNPYEFSTWLWGNATSQTVSMQIRAHESGILVGENTFSLSSTKEVHFLRNVFIAKTGLYDMVLASPAGEAATLYLWNELDLRQFILPLRPDPKPDRLWSKSLLVLNISAVLGALLLLALLRKQMHPLQYSGLFFIVLCVGMAFLSVPEQRFIMLPMIVSWILLISLVCSIKYKAAIRG